MPRSIALAVLLAALSCPALASEQALSLAPRVEPAQDVPPASPTIYGGIVAPNGAVIVLSCSPAGVAALMIMNPNGGLTMGLVPDPTICTAPGDPT